LAFVWGGVQLLLQQTRDDGVKVRQIGFACCSEDFMRLLQSINVLVSILPDEFRKDR
jgi:hypothetical protein